MRQQLFYVISWQKPGENGNTTYSSDGLFTAKPGATRYTILQQLKQELNVGNGAITFFSLIRNEL